MIFNKHFVTFGHGDNQHYGLNCRERWLYGEAVLNKMLLILSLSLDNTKSHEWLPFLKNILHSIPHCLCSVNAHRGDTQDFVRTLKDNIAPDTQMVVCILPNDRKDRYDSIKKMCCVENAGEYYVPVTSH